MASRVDDDAPRSIMVLPVKDPSAAAVGFSFHVSPQAQEEWLKRIQYMTELLARRKFHVEHKMSFFTQVDLWRHWFIVRHDYPRSV
jgi:hypothetical protein